MIACAKIDDKLTCQIWLFQTRTKFEKYHTISLHRFSPKCAKAYMYKHTSSMITVLSSRLQAFTLNIEITSSIFIIASWTIISVFIESDGFLVFCDFRTKIYMQF
jgi:hypothetical protein